eukprot:6162460-Pleurochrysis_carterae.AAC.1
MRIACWPTWRKTPKRASSTRRRGEGSSSPTPTVIEPSLTRPQAFASYTVEPQYPMVQSVSIASLCHPPKLKS